MLSADDLADAGHRITSGTERVWSILLGDAEQPRSLTKGDFAMTSALARRFGRRPPSQFGARTQHPDASDAPTASVWPHTLNSSSGHAVTVLASPRRREDVHDRALVQHYLVLDHAPLTGELLLLSRTLVHVLIVGGHLRGVSTGALDVVHIGATIPKVVTRACYTD